MKNRIIDHQSLLLEKQRLSIICKNQEKEFADAYEKLKPKLTPGYFFREALLDFIPNEMRTSHLGGLILNILNPSSERKESLGTELFNFAKSTILTTLLNYFDNFLKKGTDEKK